MDNKYLVEVIGNYVFDADNHQNVSEVINSLDSGDVFDVEAISEISYVSIDNEEYGIINVRGYAIINEEEVNNFANYINYGELQNANCEILYALEE